MARVIFWISFGFVSYVYCGYPLLLSLWRWLAKKPVNKADWEPTVSMVIAAHNEAQNIETKIRNCLLLDYPRNKLQIILSLDGATDGTGDIAREYQDCGLTVINSLAHRGKAAAINHAVVAAEGEIIVFADARQRLHHRVLRELVANFNDLSVGAVSGEMILREAGNKGDADTSHPMGLYWRYEKWLRSMESDIHSCVGASGALYAIRRELFQPLPLDTILDDVLIPMRIVLFGERLVFEPLARFYDTVASGPEEEFKRKVRTLAGNYQLLQQMPELLLPQQNPIFLQFISHKVGRLLVPYFLLALFLSNCFLLRGPYLIFFALQFAWYALALAGRFTFGRQRAGNMSKPFILGRN